MKPAQYVPSTRTPLRFGMWIQRRDAENAEISAEKQRHVRSKEYVSPVPVSASTEDREPAASVDFDLVFSALPLRSLRLCVENTFRMVTASLLLAMAAGCGYHVSGHGDMLPKTIHTIAIPAFGNVTSRRHNDLLALAPGGLGIGQHRQPPGQWLVSGLVVHQAPRGLHQRGAHPRVAVLVDGPLKAPLGRAVFPGTHSGVTGHLPPIVKPVPVPHFSLQHFIGQFTQTHR